MPHSLYVPTHAQEALRLEDFKLWFWHEKLSDAVTQDDVERIAGKYERLRNRFLKMLEKPTRYIVLSNTQNNIEDFYPYQTQGMNISLDADIVSEIACAPWATNQYGRAEMIAVTLSAPMDRQAASGCFVFGRRRYRLGRQPRTLGRGVATAFDTRSQAKKTLVQRQ